jgi:sec-independent protein translocase protein TatB
MEFFGSIGIGEIILVALVGFLVLGPERLQDAGRSIGRLVAQLMVWQQQSPEAQMVQQVRKDFEREIIELRDELVRARKQLDVSAEVRRLQEDTDRILKQKGVETEAPAVPPTRTPEAAQDDLLTHLLHEEEQRHQETQPYQHPVETRTVPRESSSSIVSEGPMSDNDEPEPAVPPVAQEHMPSSEGQHAPASTANGQVSDTVLAPYEPAIAPVSNALLSEQENLARQIQVLMADLQALQEQLRARGLLDTDWTPPSQEKQHELSSSHH